MASKSALTGGTKDVNPQYLRATVTQTAADAFTEVSIPIPVLRTNIAGRKAQVIELLGVYWDLSQGDGAAASLREVQLTTATQAGTVNIADSAFIWNHREVNRGVMTTVQLLTGYTPLNDGAGHGILVGVPSLFLAINSTSETSAQDASVSIMYRFKNVALEEFMGMVISQQ